MILAVDEKGRRVCMRGVFSRFLVMARENMKDGLECVWGVRGRGYIVGRGDG